MGLSVGLLDGVEEPRHPGRVDPRKARLPPATRIPDRKRARPTLFVSVPRLWLKFPLGVFNKMPEKKLERMLKVPILSGIVKKKVLAGLGLDQVRFAGSGSAPIPAELIQWYRNLGLELLEGYGMSENFNMSHMTMPGRGRPGYIGHPHPGVECKLSEQGEILVKSPGTTGRPPTNSGVHRHKAERVGGPLSNRACGFPAHGSRVIS